MYQHLLHLIHIFLLFFGRFLLFELNSYFSPTFLQIPTSPTFYLSYLMDTLSYWVVQQHKRFISTNTCSFNLHLAYRSPDHYYNFFHQWTQEKFGYPDAQCASAQGCYIQNRQYFKFVYYLNQLRLIWIFTRKRNFAKIDYFLRYFAIPT